MGDRGDRGDPGGEPGGEPGGDPGGDPGGEPGGDPGGVAALLSFCPLCCTSSTIQDMGAPWSSWEGKTRTSLGLTVSPR